ncbi:MAG: glycine--tRNA ligase subunit beta, partial [Thiotrichaceae bacterium]
MKQDLLIEIGTEELPPKALSTLSKAFTNSIVSSLKEARISTGEVASFASPRRLAVLIKEVDAQQPDQKTERKGPAVKAAFDADGNPTKAIQGFARSCGVEVDELSQQETNKGAWFVFEKDEKGKLTTDLIEAMVANSLQKLPTPKRMRWGDKTAEFVRPVHWLVSLFGDDVIDMNIMGLKSGRETRGHRFHQQGDISINSPSSYETQLEAGYVIASFEKRRDKVSKGAEQAAQILGGKVVIDPALLDEVTALVEWPIAVAGNFEKQFLDVPQECLITTMEDNQKYFAVVDSNNKLMPHFITTSNIESKDVAKVSEGNERVIRPRFADAEFFWEQDKKNPLETRIEATKKILFQKELGTLFEKTQRITKLAGVIAQSIGADVAQAKRAAELSKCDLMTDMVGEFPKLQGIMGRYYAIQDGETENVAYALEEQYMPRYAGDQLPEHEAGKILSIADRIDTLMGIFAIGQKPTGTKDPFALRRAALAVLRIIVESELNLDLKALLTEAASNLADKVDAKAKIEETFNYILERLNAYYKDQGIPAGVVDSVAKLRPSNPLDFDKRVKAVAHFRDLPEAESLAAANKRISNILKKQSQHVTESVNTDLLVEAAEKNLHAALVKQQEFIKPLFEQGNYEAALKALVSLRGPVDQFFDQVMVMAEDESLRDNRLALLNQLRNT